MTMPALETESAQVRTDMIFLLPGFLTSGTEKATQFLIRIVIKNKGSLGLRCFNIFSFDF